MSTDIRPEVKKTEYWIPKHRYYELKHWVMQYPDWVRYLKDHRDSLVSPAPTDLDKIINGSVSDPTWDATKRRQYYIWAIDTLMRVARMTDERFGQIVMNNVITETGFKDCTDGLKISRSEYYILYRKFFWLLDQERD